MGRGRRPECGTFAEAFPKLLQRGEGLSSAPAGFEFGTFRLDPDKGVLWHDGALVPLTPKVLALLQALVEARGDVVPKANLMARVWPDTVVGDANLSVTVSALRRGLGQHAGDPAWVETVPRRGYRFTAPLRAPAASPALVLAILPFRGIGPDAEDHLGLGIADALIGALTGVENVTVRPTGAVAHFAHQHVAPLEAAEALGADAVLDGTVQRQDHRVRIAVQLIPRRAGLAVLGRALRGRGGDIFALHDRIAEQVALALRAKLSRWRDAGPRATRRPGFEAWDTYLRGRYLWARLDTDGVTKALGCFGEAASREPSWAEPRAGLAAVHVLLGVGGIVPPRRAWRVAGECAREALERDAVLPEAHLASAWVPSIAIGRGRRCGPVSIARRPWGCRTSTIGAPSSSFSRGTVGPAATPWRGHGRPTPSPRSPSPCRRSSTTWRGSASNRSRVAPRGGAARRALPRALAARRGSRPPRASRRGDRFAHAGRRAGRGRHRHAL
jgi:DNA-binding winged helix-turn-helix (wHTH) protein